MVPGSQMKLLAIAMATCATACLAFSATAAMNSVEEYYVELHNTARAVAGAGPVLWDGEAARHAAKRTTTACAGVGSSSTGVGGGQYGENVFRSTLWKDWAAVAADALRAWTAPAASEYVQVVWPGSNRIGCAHAVCPDERSVVVRCSYKPAVKEDLRLAPLPSYCRYNISRCYDCPIC